MSLIYLDNNATTIIAPEVLDSMLPFLYKYYGNASSALPRVITFGLNANF